MRKRGVAGLIADGEKGAVTGGKGTVDIVDINTGEAQVDGPFVRHAGLSQQGKSVLPAGIVVDGDVAAGI